MLDFGMNSDPEESFGRKGLSMCFETLMKELADIHL